MFVGLRCVGAVHTLFSVLQCFLIKLKFVLETMREFKCLEVYLTFTLQPAQRGVQYLA